MATSLVLRRRPSRAISQAGSPVPRSTKKPWTSPMAPPSISLTSAPTQDIASASEGIAAASVIGLPLQQLAGGAGRVQLPPHHPFQQLRRGRVVGDGRLQAAPHPRGGDAEHLAAQVAGAALGQPPRLL